MFHEGSTVTVVLLTLEALVVALVADVVLATYPSRHLDRKEANGIAPVHSYREGLDEIKLRQSAQLTDNYVNQHLPEKAAPQWRCSRLLC